MKEYCETCVFWAVMADDEGMCVAVESDQPGRVARAIVMCGMPSENSRVRVWNMLDEDNPDYRGSLITPPDFGCTSYQPQIKE